MYAEETINNLTTQHELFMKHVGCHTDYDENNKRTVGLGMKPNEEWRQFYNNREAIDVNSHLIRQNRIGWFDSNSMYYYQKENI